MTTVQTVDDVQFFLKWLQALIGTGRVALASEPLLVIPAGMQVAGSNPWFCRKKITLFGPPEALGAARPISGNIDAPNAALKPDASVCKDFLRLIMGK